MFREIVYWNSMYFARLSYIVVLSLFELNVKWVELIRRSWIMQVWIIDWVELLNYYERLRCRDVTDTQKATHS